MTTFSINNINAQLSVVETESLQYMYEEEKMAHDVYLYMSEKYSLPIFKNITKSEKYHMSLVDSLIKKYNIKDITGNEVGVFNNKTLQNLYNDLIFKGSVDILEALNVGAT